MGVLRCLDHEERLARAWTRAVGDWERKLAGLEESCLRKQLPQDHYLGQACEATRTLLAVRGARPASAAADKLLAPLVQPPNARPQPSTLMRALAVDRSLSYARHQALGVELAAGYLSSTRYDPSYVSHLGRLLDGRYRQDDVAQPAARHWRALLNNFNPSGFFLDNLFALSSAYHAAVREGDEALATQCLQLCDRTWQALGAVADRTQALRAVKDAILRLPNAGSEAQVLLALVELDPQQAALADNLGEAARRRHQLALITQKSQALEGLRDRLAAIGARTDGNAFEQALRDVANTRWYVAANFSAPQAQGLLMRVLGEALSKICHRGLQHCFRRDKRRARALVDHVLQLSQVCEIDAPSEFLLHALYTDSRAATRDSSRRPSAAANGADGIGGADDASASPSDDVPLGALMYARLPRSSSMPSLLANQPPPTPPLATLPPPPPSAPPYPFPNAPPGRLRRPSPLLATPPGDLDARALRGRLAAAVAQGATTAKTTAATGSLDLADAANVADATETADPSQAPIAPPTPSPPTWGARKESLPGEAIWRGSRSNGSGDPKGPTADHLPLRQLPALGGVRAAVAARRGLPPLAPPVPDLADAAADEANAPPASPAGQPRSVGQASPQPRSSTHGTLRRPSSPQLSPTQRSPSQRSLAQASSPQPSPTQLSQAQPSPSPRFPGQLSPTQPSSAQTSPILAPISPLRPSATRALHHAHSLAGQAPTSPRPPTVVSQTPSASDETFWRETVFGLSHLRTSDEAASDGEDAAQLLYALFYDEPNMRRDEVVRAKSLYLAFARVPQASAALRRLLENLNAGALFALPGDYQLLRRLAGEIRLPEVGERHQPPRALHSTVVRRLRAGPTFAALDRAVSEGWARFDVATLRPVHDFVRRLCPARGPAPWLRGHVHLEAFSCWEPRWDRLQQAARALRSIEDRPSSVTGLAGARAVLRRYLVLEGPSINFGVRGPHVSDDWQLRERGHCPSMSQQLEVAMERNAALQQAWLEISAAAPHGLRFVMGRANVTLVHHYLRCIDEALSRSSEGDNALRTALGRLDRAGRLTTLEDEVRALTTGAKDAFAL